MPADLFVDLDAIDLTQVHADVDQIEQVNPQRGHMRHLDRIVWVDDPKDCSLIVGYKDVRDDEFWVPDHIPGRPLLPGVLMIEAAAQMAGWAMKQWYPKIKFVGFLGCDKVKFRDQVVPGQRLILIGKKLKMTHRRCTCSVQGVVDGKLVFEAEVTGYPL